MIILGIKIPKNPFLKLLLPYRQKHGIYLENLPTIALHIHN